MVGRAQNIRRGLEAEVRAGGPGWAPWLVYADFLTQQGDARGELIGLAHRRVEALERGAQGSMLAAELAERIRGLVTSHGDDWRGDALPDDWEPRWRCGFIVGLRVPLRETAIEALRKRLAKGQLSLLAELEFDTTAERGDGWEEEDEARYEPGYVPPPMGTQCIAQLLTLELSGLRRLGLRYGSLERAAITQLASCLQLASLRELDLRYNYLSDEALAPLWASPHLHALEELHLHQNRLGFDTVEALVGAPTAATLRHIDLRGNPLGKAGARTLAQAPELAALSSLGLELADIGEAGALLLANSPLLKPNIRRYWKARCGAKHDDLA